MEGSSYYRLPWLLRFFSGSIGYHHIHHLNPRIPNYNLARCFRELPEARDVRPITLWKSLRSLFLNLYDEKEKMMVPFRALRRLRAKPAGS